MSKMEVFDDFMKNIYSRFYDIYIYMRELIIKQKITLPILRLHENNYRTDKISFEVSDLLKSLLAFKENDRINLFEAHDHPWFIFGVSKVLLSSHITPHTHTITYNQKSSKNVSCTYTYTCHDNFLYRIKTYMFFLANFLKSHTHTQPMSIQQYIDDPLHHRLKIGTIST